MKKPITQAPESTSQFCLKGAYLFCGPPRDHDLRSCLQDICNAFHHSLELTEMDLLRCHSHDLADPLVQQAVIDQLPGLHFIMVSPPCGTFSRAPWSGHPGPSPVRSAQYPLGFPWMSALLKHKAETANALIRFSWTLAALVESQHKHVTFVLEHPEDLGTTPKGRPASIWQSTEFCNLLKAGWSTVALNQCAFGSPSRKPTRLLSNRDISHLGWPGPPTFSPSGHYRGPAQHCGHQHEPLIGSFQGSFRTAAAAAYPPSFCLTLAEVLSQVNCTPLGGVVHIGSSQGNSTGAVESAAHPPVPDSQPEADTPPDSGGLGAAPAAVDGTSDEDDWGRRRPKRGEGWCPRTPPVHLAPGGSRRRLRDGGGLCSPGQWPPDSRQLPPNGLKILHILQETLELREEKMGQGANLRLFASLCCGRVDANPLAAEAAAAASKVRELLRAEGIEMARPVPHPSPSLDFPLLKGLASFLGDPDAGGVDHYIEGVRLGVARKLPRTPAVFPRKTKWRLEEWMAEDAEEFSANYSSAAARPEVVEQELRAHLEEGMFVKMPYKKAKEKYGDQLRVAPLALVEERGGSFRVVHDATHHVKVNHRIRVRDLEEMPTAADVAAAINADPMPGSQLVGFVWDVAKAHRRVPVHPDDWGWQACAVDQPPDAGDLDLWELWLNTVGTYGVGSASYWWGRLGALLTRVAYYTLSPSLRWLFRFADDFLLIAGGKGAWKVPLLMILLLGVLRAPIKWKKVGGGFKLQWVGFEFCLSSLQVGLSDKRSEWVISWVERVLKDQGVLVRDFKAALGRLCFATVLLRHLHPFLAPLYTWASAVPDGAYLPLPVAVCCCLKWIAERMAISAKISMRPAVLPQGELFRTDAKAEGNLVVVGGWKVIANEPCVQKAWWFSETLTPELAPWAFEKGQPSRSIAALELFAALIAVMLFVHKARGESAIEARMVLTGSTDNQACHYLSKRWLSTKFPVNLVLMELATQLDVRGAALTLDWIPREANREADALTNLDFHSFDPGRRLHFNWADPGWAVLPRLVEAATDLFRQANERRALQRSARLAPNRGGGKREAKLRVRDPW